MLLFWKIRYLDTRDRQFKDRNLFLDTDTLDPTTKAAIETIRELAKADRDRRLLRYRHLFKEHDPSPADPHTRNHAARVDGFCLVDYFEDENGKEITDDAMAVVLTGNPDAMSIPPGAREHDIDLKLANKPPIVFADISLSPEGLSALGYFSRDIGEMRSSALYRDGPGTLHMSPGSVPTLETAISLEESRSIAMVFRRLYMEKEPGNFLNALAVFRDAMPGHPLARWAECERAEYRKMLQEKPRHSAVGGCRNWTYSLKFLIDAFLYTQYAHQPDARRARQFQECLAAASCSLDLLTWMFLTELWSCCLFMSMAGTIVGGFYQSYCESHGLPTAILPSPGSLKPGLGNCEKKDAHEKRLIEERAQEIGTAAWMAAGRPPDGPSRHVDEARKSLQLAVAEKVDGRRTEQAHRSPR